MPCSGIRTVTCTVCGRKPFLANDTDWFSGGTVSEQGVRQVWPCAVRTSAPGGSDSNCKAAGGGGDEWNDIQSGIDNDELEHPASAVANATTLAVTIRRTRNMNTPVLART